MQTHTFTADRSSGRGIIAHASHLPIANHPVLTLFFSFAELKNDKIVCTICATGNLSGKRTLHNLQSKYVFENQKPDKVVNNLHQTVCSWNLCDTHSDAEYLLSTHFRLIKWMNFSFRRWKNVRWAIYSSIEFRHFSEYFLRILRFVSGHLSLYTWTKESVAAFCPNNDHEWTERGGEREKTVTKESPKIDIPATCAL